MKKYFFLFSFVMIILVITTYCSKEKARHTSLDNDISQKTDTSTAVAKNIILLIGDGMGIAHIYAAMTVNIDKLNIEEFSEIGFSKTYSIDNYITDSGAGATAMATGQKTNNSSIGVDKDGNSLKNIIEISEEEGKATGLVSTSAITHATPASFIAHEVSRNSYEEIAADFLSTDIDLFIGGGKVHFTDRSDNRNLIDELVANNYNVVFSINDADAITEGKIACFTAEEHNPSIVEGRGNMLPDATSIAINNLNKNEKGFFLMVEGSQIDWASHDGNIDYLVQETIDFDKAVGIALEFAKNNKETLVIVTADHETGGLTLTGGNIDLGEINSSFSSKTHTAVMVPVFAYGPGAELFKGIYENTELFNKMTYSLGLKTK